MRNRKVVLTDRVVLASPPAAKEYSIHDAALRGFALRVQPSGAKTWVLRLRIDGVPRRISIGGARKMAVAEARAKAHALLAKGQTAEWAPRAEGPTFAAFAAIYRDRRAPGWKPSTLRTHDVYMRCTLMPFFASMQIDAITKADVARWFHAYSAIRPGGANRALAILSDIFARARDWGVLRGTANNPCRGVTRNRTAPRGRVLNTEDPQRLGAALDRHAALGRGYARPAGPGRQQDRPAPRAPR